MNMVNFFCCITLSLLFHSTMKNFSDFDGHAKILQEVQFPFVSKRTCERAYRSWAGADKICTEARGKDTCDVCSDKVLDFYTCLSELRTA